LIGIGEHGRLFGVLQMTGAAHMGG
jgi:hypothetical protein